MRVLRSLLLLAALNCPSAAQIIQGTITGNVTDSAGAGIPGVAVSVTNDQTGTVSRTVTTGLGVYSAPALPAGTYSINAEKTGFQRVAVHGLILESAQT